MTTPQPSPPGLHLRLGALLYDVALLIGVLFVATALLLSFRGGEAIPAHQMAFNAYLLAIAFLFFGWFWTHGGQTLGMRAWKIRLCSDGGGPVGWRQAAIRFSVGLLSLALFGLGFWWSWRDREKLCWHDRLAGTRMVRPE